ncbi:hypothetical protein [Desulfosarcina variabilis]|uniref:hypothetical protein n=1 Tax=Desulfosarcina variabilis TaxID=2300 RepID=UPI003AFA8FD1
MPQTFIGDLSQWAKPMSTYVLLVDPALKMIGVRKSDGRKRGEKHRCNRRRTSAYEGHWHDMLSYRMSFAVEAFHPDTHAFFESGP